MAFATTYFGALNKRLMTKFRELQRYEREKYSEILQKWHELICAKSLFPPFEDMFEFIPQTCFVQNILFEVIIQSGFLSIQFEI